MPGLYINHYFVSFKSVVNFLLKNKHKVSVKLLSISFKGVKENLTHLQLGMLGLGFTGGNAMA